MKEVIIFFSEDFEELCEPNSSSCRKQQLKNILDKLSTQKNKEANIINIDDEKTLIVYPEKEIPHEEKKKIIPQDIQVIFLVFHKTTMENTSKNIISQFKEIFPNVKIHWCFYSHICDETSPWKALSDLLWALSSSNKTEAIKLFDKLAELKIVSNLSLLKHRLMHLLGPIDNDLQALWSEAERTGRKGFDPGKWKEVCDAYKDYKEDEILHSALEMIEKSINEIKEGLSEPRKEKAEEFLPLIMQAKTAIESQKGSPNKNKELFVDLIEKMKNLLKFIRRGEMNKVYKMLSEESGLSPIYRWFEDLEKKLEDLT
jgi:hypothetical protein